MAADTVRVEVIDRLDAWSRVAQQWNDLVARAPDSTVFQTYEWNQGVWRAHKGDELKLWVLLAFAGDQLVGVAPFCVQPYGFAKRILFIGFEVSDYLHLILDPGWATACVHSFEREISRTFSWSLFLCFPLATDSQSAAITFRKGFRFELPGNVCPGLDLPRTWDEYYSALPGQMKRDIAQGTKRLSQQESFSIHRVTGEDVGPALESFFDLHTKRWQTVGVPGAFGTEKSRALFGAAVRAIASRGWLRLYSLNLFGEPKCVLVVYCFGASWSYHHAGRDPDPNLSRYNIGTVLLAEAIKDSIEEGAKYFDFNGGDEPYKFKFGAKATRKTVYRVEAKPWIFGALYSVPFRFAARRSRSLSRRVDPHEENRQVFASPAAIDYYGKFKELQKCEVYVFDKYIQSGQRILDLGVGGGRTTQRLAENAKQYVAIDYSEGMIEQCKETFPEHSFCRADAADLKMFGDSSFDVVVFSFNGIDYLHPNSKRLQCLSESARVLSAGGTFIFSCHNARWCFVKPSFEGAYGFRRVRRILGAIRESLRLSLRMLPTAAFWKGQGYVWDPAHGGLYTQMVIPSAVVKEVSKAGFDWVETVNGNYPAQSISAATLWYYYVFRKRA